MYLSAPPHPLSGDGMAAARIPTYELRRLAHLIRFTCHRKCSQQFSRAVAKGDAKQPQQPPPPP